MRDEFIALLNSLKIDKSKPIDETVVKAEVFEKDNDSNFHIDFMYAMANCRSKNYKLDEMDWLTVKLKAGKIVPAMATTTASVAGLQALELVKLVKGEKLAVFRNTFMNLAVPMMTGSSPGEVKKDKLLDGLEVSIWDRWELKDFKNNTLEHMITKIQEKYVGLVVRDVMRGNMPIYQYAFMMFEGKQAERKKILETALRTLTDCDSDAYVDLTISCVRTSDE